MNKIELPFAIIEYKEPIVYYKMTKDVMYDGKMIQQIIDAGNKLCDKKPYLVLSDVRVSADLTAEAREVAVEKKNADNIIADAVLVKWLAQRLGTNVLIQLNKPPYPMQVFTDEDKAVKWLLEQKALWEER